MNCSSAEARFERFLDGELTPRERGGMLAHVDSCAACGDVFAELRAVDALLIEPRRVELAPNFTAATMAHARSLDTPRVYRTPIRAYVVSYLAGAWLVTGAAYMLAPQATRAVAGAVIDVARTVTDAVGGLSSVVARSLGHDGTTIGALLGALLAFDLVLVVACGAALKYVRPALLERPRS